MLVCVKADWKLLFIAYDHVLF